VLSGLFGKAPMAQTGQERITAAQLIFYTYM